MKGYTITILLTLFVLAVRGQDKQVNFIIQVNKQLVDGELTNMRIAFADDRSKTYLVGYVPGELSLPNEAYLRLTNEKDTASATLYFDYYSYRKNGKYGLVNWKVNLHPVLFKQPFLILNIYDFRERLYKKMYGYHTDEDYICEWGFPGSGLLIPMK